MNKLKNISVFILLFVSAFFTSCNNEPYEGEIPGSNPQTVNNGQSTGNYWPTAINNEWTYAINGTNQSPKKMISNDVVGGNNYYTFNAALSVGANTTVNKIRKSNGDYFIKSDDVVVAAQPGVSGSTSNGTERIILKDYLNVAESWNYNYTETTTYTDPSIPTQTINFSFVSTIVEKNSTVNLNGHVYTDVIKVRVVETAIKAGQTSTSTSYYSFAKNVGPITFLTQSVFGGTTTTEDLASYTLN